MISQHIKCTHIAGTELIGVFALYVEVNDTERVMIELCDRCYDQLKGAIFQGAINQAAKFVSFKLER